MKKLLFIICMVTIAAAANSQATKQPKQTKGNPVESSVKQKADTVKAAAPNSDSTQKILVLQGSVEGFQALVIALEKSNESHVVIESLKQWIVPQINGQLQPKSDPKK